MKLDIQIVDLAKWPPRKQDGSAESAAIRWLGQAGFYLRYKKTDLLIDPYLSDSLARKYQGKEFAHVRMMPPPLDPRDIHNLDWVLCTHRHSDHMDPETIQILSRENPRCRWIMPRAEYNHVLDLGLKPQAVRFVNAAEVHSLAAGIDLEAIPSAHEEITIDSAGCHRFLGYILYMGNVRLYHSGDCAPYPGLAECLAGKKIDVALLPVNGRDYYRRSRNVPGNFTVDEAVELCAAAGIPHLIAHHFGMFEFNTVDPEEIQTRIHHLNTSVHCVIPDVRNILLVSKLK